MASEISKLRKDLDDQKKIVQADVASVHQVAQTSMSRHDQLAAFIDVAKSEREENREAIARFSERLAKLIEVVDGWGDPSNLEKLHVEVKNSLSETENLRDYWVGVLEQSQKEVQAVKTEAKEFSDNLTAEIADVRKKLGKKPAWGDLKAADAKISTLQTNQTDLQKKVHRNIDRLEGNLAKIGTNAEKMDKLHTHFHDDMLPQVERVKADMQQEAQAREESQKEVVGRFQIVDSEIFMVASEIGMVREELRALDSKLNGTAAVVTGKKDLTARLQELSEEHRSPHLAPEGGGTPPP